MDVVAQVMNIQQSMGMAHDEVLSVQHTARMLNTRGSSFNKQKKRILARKTCILLYFIVWYSRSPRIWHPRHTARAMELFDVADTSRARMLNARGGLVF